MEITTLLQDHPPLMENDLLLVRLKQTLCYDLRGKKRGNAYMSKAYMGASLGEACSPVF